MTMHAADGRRQLITRRRPELKTQACTVVQFESSIPSRASNLSRSGSRSPVSAAAKSCFVGTLILLAADEIVMSKHAVLGPVDPQLGQSPAASLLKVVEQKQKPIAEIDDQTLVMAEVGRKAITHAKAPDAAIGCRRQSS